MAFTTGTATSYLNLLDQFHDYLLVQGWTRQYPAIEPAWTVDTEVFFLAPGPTGSTVDDSYLNIKTESGNGKFTWALNAAVSFVDTGAARFLEQTGSIGPLQTSIQPETTIPKGIPRLLFPGPTTIDYVFYVNTTRAIVLTRNGAFTQFMYLGRIDAYGAPTDYPYPVFAGGCHNDCLAQGVSDGALSLYSGSSVEAGHHFWAFSPVSTQNKAANGYIRLPSGAWSRLRTWKPQSNSETDPEAAYYAHPAGFVPRVEDAAGITTVATTDTTTQNVALFPLQCALNVGGVPSLVGRWDGVYWVSGIGPAGAPLGAGDTITVGADTYDVVNDVNRGSANDFLAVKRA